MPLHQCLALACCLQMFIACAAAQVDVAIATSKTAYVAGEPVFINVRITNTSTSPLTVVVPSSGLLLVRDQCSRRRARSF
jgi:hypothetical protein